MKKKPFMSNSNTDHLIFFKHHRHVTLFLQIYMYTVTVVAQKYKYRFKDAYSNYLAIVDHTMGSVNTCGLYTLFWYSKKKTIKKQPQNHLYVIKTFIAIA